jgi:hypothetical protein
VSPAARAGVSLLALLAAGCASSGIEGGVFHSKKGYQVSLPAGGWRVARDSKADLELRRERPPGGMLADATCDARLGERPPEHLVRYLTFGLKHREEVRTEPVTVGGRAGARSVLRGTLDGAEVAVDAVSVKGEGCVYDFLYVAPVDAFEAGRGDFQAFVDSLALPAGAAR